jgi:hypothetical protein
VRTPASDGHVAQWHDRTVELGAGPSGGLGEMLDAAPAAVVVLASGPDDGAAASVHYVNPAATELFPGVTVGSGADALGTASPAVG